MNRFFLAFALMLIGTTTAHTDEADCLPVPTQACVFQMALRQADDERPNFLATGYLAVAYLQEQERTGEAAQTRSALLAKLRSADPDPTKAYQALDFAASTPSFTADYELGDQPESDQWLRATLVELSREAGLPPNDYSGLEPTALKAEIRARIAATPADTLQKFSRLETMRGPEVIRIDMHVAGLPFDLDLGHTRFLKGLFAKGALSGAKAEIDSWSDARQRANGHAALALAFARAGEIDQALSLAHLPELASPTLLGLDAKLGLVEVWARAGVLKSDEILAGVSGLADLSPESNPALKAKIIVAMVKGDILTAHGLLATVEPGHRGTVVVDAIDAALDHDPARVHALVTLFPRGERAEILHHLGKAQIRVGDVQQTLVTVEQLEGLPDPIHGAHILRGLLAPVLAATGREAEGVQMAAELNDAGVTALVAARLR
jgi:hypothetical protein